MMLMAMFMFMFMPMYDTHARATLQRAQHSRGGARALSSQVNSQAPTSRGRRRSAVTAATAATAAIVATAALLPLLSLLPVYCRYCRYCRSTAADAATTAAYLVLRRDILLGIFPVVCSLFGNIQQNYHREPVLSLWPFTILFFCGTRRTNKKETKNQYRYVADVPGTARAGWEKQRLTDRVEHDNKTKTRNKHKKRDKST